MATNGKSIRISNRDDDQFYQDFVALVSAFSVSQGLVLGLEPKHNGQTSETKTVETLLDKLYLTGVCFSLDDLHAQKTGATDCQKWQ